MQVTLLYFGLVPACVIAGTEPKQLAVWLSLCWNCLMFVRNWKLPCYLPAEEKGKEGLHVFSILANKLKALSNATDMLCQQQWKRNRKLPLPSLLQASSRKAARKLPMFQIDKQFLKREEETGEECCFFSLQWKNGLDHVSSVTWGAVWLIFACGWKDHSKWCTTAQSDQFIGLPNHTLTCLIILADRSSHMHAHTRQSPLQWGRKLEGMLPPAYH